MIWEMAKNSFVKYEHLLTSGLAKSNFVRQRVLLRNFGERAAAEAEQKLTEEDTPTL